MRREYTEEYFASSNLPGLLRPALDVPDKQLTMKKEKINRKKEQRD